MLVSSDGVSIGGVDRSRNLERSMDQLSLDASVSGNLSCPLPELAEFEHLHAFGDGLLQNQVGIAMLPRGDAVVHDEALPPPTQSKSPAPGVGLLCAYCLYFCSFWQIKFCSSSCILFFECASEGAACQTPQMLSHLLLL